MGKKIRTVIASVLKPVDDSRMYEKIGLSLQQTNRYDVNIIGFASKKYTSQEDIRQIGLFSFGRTNPLRLLSPFVVFKWLIRLRPELLVITTYELLWIAVLYKKIYPNTQLIYDIQENYASNANDNRTAGAFSKIFTKIISYTERKCQPFIKLNLLAEISYLKELCWLNSPTCVLLNKYKEIAIDSGPKTSADLMRGRYPIIIFSGTISENYGIREAVDLVKNLSKYFSNIVLVVAGHLVNNKLLNILDNIPYILNLSIPQPFPHAEILQLMKMADFGIVSHRPVESIKNCFPTRIYELMAHKVPILVRNHPFWSDYCVQRDAGIVVDFDNYDATAIAQQMKTSHFYRSGIPNDIYWTSEEEKLIKAIDMCFD